MLIEGIGAGIAAAAKKAASAVKKSTKPKASGASAQRAAFERASQPAPPPAKRAAPKTEARPRPAQPSGSPTVTLNRLPEEDRQAVRQARIASLDDRAQTLRAGLASMGTGGGYATAAMQQELSAVEADLAALNPPPAVDRAESGRVPYSTGLALMDGVLANTSGIVPLSASASAPSDPIPVTGLTSGSVDIYEETDESGTTSVVVTDSSGTVLGSYAPGSTVDLEVHAGAAQVHVARDTDVTVNVETGDGNLLVDIQGGTSDVHVVGNEHSNIIRVSTDGDVSVDSGDGADDISIDDADEVTVRSSGGNNEISVEEARIVDIEASGTGENRIDVRDVRGRVGVVTGDGDQVVDIDDAYSAEVTTGSGNDEITATALRGGAVIDTGDATDFQRTTGHLWWRETEDVEGSDAVIVEAARDVNITTGDGWDLIDAASSGGNVAVASGSGRDDIVADADGDATIDAGSFNDTVEVTGADHAEITGGEHNDIIQITHATTATIDGGDGDDVVDSYGVDRATVRGGAGSDYLRTGDGADDIEGGAGDDVIYAGDGADTIDGGDGDDYVDGGRGGDEIDGGRGRDVLSGNAGSDTIRGGANDDVLIADAGYDNLDGGTDDQRTIFNGPGQPPIVEGGDVLYHQHNDVRANGEIEEVSNIPDNFDPEADLQRINVDAGASDNFRDRVHDDLATLRAIPTGAEGLDLLENAVSGTGEEHDITIQELPLDVRNGFARPDNRGDANSEDQDGDGSPDADEGTPATISYNPSFSLDAVSDYNPATGEYNRDGRAAPPIGVLYHEIAHAYDDITGQLEDNPYSGADGRDNGEEVVVDENSTVAAPGPNGVVERDPILNAERDAVGLDIERPDGSTDSRHPEALTENALRDALGLEARESYR